MESPIQFIKRHLRVTVDIDRPMPMALFSCPIYKCRELDVEWHVFVIVKPEWVSVNFATYARYVDDFDAPENHDCDWDATKRAFSAIANRICADCVSTCKVLKVRSPGPIWF